MSKDNRRLRVFVKHAVNPVLRNLTRSARGPFALLRHVGRRSGKAFETPIMAFRYEHGFIIVLTYGPGVDWLRNIQATGQGRLRWHQQEYVIREPKFIDAQTALPALPPFIRFVLQSRKVHDFVKFTSQPAS